MYFKGAILMIGAMMLIPVVQDFFYNITVKRFDFPRWGFSYLAILSIVLLVFLSIPHALWQISLGGILIVISLAMMFIVPKNKTLRTWLEKTFFGGNDILDKEAPYSKVVSLFKLPLLGLGLWVIAPWTVIILDIGAVTAAFIWWVSRSTTAEKQKQITIIQENGEDIIEVKG